MAQSSVFITVFAVSVLIAHTLCFRVETVDEQSVVTDVKAEPRQVADNILVIQDASQVPTTAASLPSRIRDTVLSTLNNLGNNVRQAPARVTECFQNITKCANTILRRNQTMAVVQTQLTQEE